MHAAHLDGREDSVGGAANEGEDTVGVVATVSHGSQKVDEGSGVDVAPVLADCCEDAAKAWRGESLDVCSGGPSSHRRSQEERELLPVPWVLGSECSCRGGAAVVVGVVPDCSDEAEGMVVIAVGACRWGDGVAAKVGGAELPVTVFKIGRAHV